MWQQQTTCRGWRLRGPDEGFWPSPMGLSWDSHNCSPFILVGLQCLKGKSAIREPSAWAYWPNLCLDQRVDGSLVSGRRDRDTHFNFIFEVFIYHRLTIGTTNWKKSISLSLKAFNLAKLIWKVFRAKENLLCYLWCSTVLRWFVSKIFLISCTS